MTQNGAARRASYQRAVEHRADLDARDLRLLDVVGGPEQPGGVAAIAKRALDAARDFPGDAEMWALAAGGSDAEADIGHARRAIALDPEYADAWQMLADAAARLGKNDERRQALDRCITISRSSPDCRADRAKLLWASGRCDESMTDLREAIALSPKSSHLRGDHVEFLMLLDRPYETQLAALQDRWALLGGERAYLEPSERMELEFNVGHNVEAERQRKAVEELIRREDTPHAEAVILVVADLKALLDSERIAEAGLVADAFLKRAEAWGDTRRPLPATVHYAALRAGKISRSDYEQTRRALGELERATMPTSDPWHIWARVHPYFLDREEAEAALAARPPSAPNGIAVRLLAKWEALAGHGKEALALLADAQPCERLRGIDVALAHEQVGEIDEACERYASVVERFGKDQPTPVSVKMAKEHLGRLHCKARPSH
jgi:tetratricopeptide (TPR) repeat protein